MRKVWLIVLAIVVIFSAVVLNSQAESAKLRGDYVEVRTASVFAGACHYNGELTTTGRDALMAWNVTSGQWQGVDLSGVRVMAVISAGANLSDESAAHRSEIFIDRDASDVQEAAILDALKNKYAVSLGQIVSVRRAPVSFDHVGKVYSVNATELASISVEAMPNDECCRMPNLVWYSPLVPLVNRKVGYTKQARYVGGSASEAWQRSSENSAFYGTFSF
jgi:hypothetical protein